MPDTQTEKLAIASFQLERLCGPIAEGELSDMGLTEGAARAEIAWIMTRLRQPF
jgi:hypothetical protein